MKVKLLLSIIFVVSLFSIVSSASDGVELTANFIEQNVGIYVEPAVTLPDVTNGYSASSNIGISNVGTVDMIITSELQGMDYYWGNMSANDEDYNSVFDLLELDLNGDYLPVWDFQGFMEKPEIVGDVRTQTLVFRLNLENYTQFIDIYNNQVAVVFTAVPA